MKQIIDKLKNIIKDEKVVIAVSTGVDSMTLLDLCLKANLSKQIIIAHVNHGLRNDSLREEEYISSFAKLNNIKLEILHINGKDYNIDLENTFRTLRYNFFEEVLGKYDAKFLLLAHNANDNIETIIMRLIKGSSIESLIGIKEYLEVNNHIYFRPLLKITKEDIYKYADNNKIVYFEDSSNKENDYQRNRIRHNVIPALLNENPNLFENIDYFTYQMNGVWELLEEKFSTFKQNGVLVFNEEYLTIRIDYKLLNKEDTFLKYQILFNVLKPFSLSRNIIDHILDIINCEKDKSISLLGNVKIVKEYGYIYVSNNLNPKLDFFLEISKEGDYLLPNNDRLIVEINNCQLVTKKGKIWYNNINLPIIIRTRKNGDKLIRNVNGKTITQSVSNILTNKKLPYYIRENVMLLESNNEIKYILGLKIN